MLEAVEVDAALVVVPVLVVDWILVEEEEVVPATVVVVDVGVTTVDPPHAVVMKSVGSSGYSQTIKPASQPRAFACTMQTARADGLM